MREFKTIKKTHLQRASEPSHEKTSCGSVSLTQIVQLIDKAFYETEFKLSLSGLDWGNLATQDVQLYLLLWNQSLLKWTLVYF